MFKIVAYDNNETVSQNIEVKIEQPQPPEPDPEPTLIVKVKDTDIIVEAGGTYSCASNLSGDCYVRIYPDIGTLCGSIGTDPTSDHESINSVLIYSNSGYLEININKDIDIEALEVTVTATVCVDEEYHNISTTFKVNVGPAVLRPLPVDIPRLIP